ncbi:hypothetical protein ES332_A06G015600v1 [Gossypium tomentosum]|uniref:Uncharacterized protein n=1 Tax=Gossypium tomentosum TaxID=34277 RepID=A0A5D2Q146_GOSTO|nr:hypothetical protein ES332_A06G015600v1 [Gossypium tomentosum]
MLSTPLFYLFLLSSTRVSTPIIAGGHARGVVVVVRKVAHGWPSVRRLEAWGVAKVDLGLLGYLLWL